MPDHGFPGCNRLGIDINGGVREPITWDVVEDSRGQYLNSCEQQWGNLGVRMHCGTCTGESADGLRRNVGIRESGKASDPAAIVDLDRAEARARRILFQNKRSEGTPA